jgi:NAD(P)H-hydrate repair Nnr-like enzyme with NAD(P)H-hydrate dehydratase domain
LEAARLLGYETARVQADRLQAADALARELAAVVLLKGSGSVIACRGRMPVVNPTGSASLAVGGTGDVLAGWIGGLWACAGRAWEPGDLDAGWRCAVAAAWLHGLAGERPGASPVRAGALAEAMASSAEAWRARQAAASVSAAYASVPLPSSDLPRPCAQVMRPPHDGPAS